MSTDELSLADLRRLQERQREERLVRGLDLTTGTYPIPPSEFVVGQTPPSDGDQMT